MKIKEIDRTGNIAWSPSPIAPVYLAVGTAAQQLDSSFSSNAALELYNFNVNDPGMDMPIKSSINCLHRFHKLVWGSVDSTHESGVIVGGCDGGVMQVYDATKIINGTPEPLIFTKNKHSGAVRALDFNTFRPNLLASGASESEILIWDLHNPKTPMSPGARVQPPDDVSHLAWNKQVEHILASTFSTRCVVWDLRKNEPIIKVADSTSRIRYKAVEWHPAVATQMILASEDDSNPVIQLWDLRNATSPLKVIQGHQRGVLGLSWCAQDPELLISCGKDSRILCWNPNYYYNGYEMTGEIPTSSQWTFDAQFCPSNPILIASSSFDGHINVFALSGGVNMPVSSSKLADSFPGMDMTVSHAPVPSQKPTVFQLRDPPKWLKRPCGASFTFGGKLIKFSNEKKPQDAAVQGPQQYTSTVVVEQVMTLPAFVERSKKLEEALKSGSLEQYCYEKAQQATGTIDSGVWEFLQGSFSNNPRSAYISKLGFDTEKIVEELSQLDIGTSSDTCNNDLFGAPENRGTGDGPLTNGFANNIEPSYNIPEFEIPTDSSVDGQINKALLCGSIEIAVDLCLQEERWADAILLASRGGQELMYKAQNRYFQKKGSSTSSMIRAIVTQDMKILVEKCNLSSWRQSLATVLSYASEQDFHHFSEILGERLEAGQTEDSAFGALVCYICSGSLNRLANVWIQSSASSAGNTPEGLQDLVEQIMVLQKAAEQRGRESTVTNGLVASKLVEYATLLASQGCLETALNYLGDSTEPSIMKLKEQLQYALNRFNRPTKSQLKPRSRQSSESSNLHRGLQKRPSHPSVANALPGMMTPATDFHGLSGPPSGANSYTSGYSTYGSQSVLSGTPSNVPQKPVGMYQTQQSVAANQSQYVSSSAPAPPLYNPSTATPATSVQQPPSSMMPPSSYGSASMVPPIASVTSSSVNSSAPPAIFNPMATGQSPNSSANVFTPSSASSQPMPAQQSHVGTAAVVPPPPRSSSTTAWNDPPMFKQTPKPKTPASTVPAMEPIRHPIFGAAAPPEQYQPQQQMQYNSNPGLPPVGPPPPMGSTRPSMMGVSQSSQRVNSLIPGSGVSQMPPPPSGMPGPPPSSMPGPPPSGIAGPPPSGISGPPPSGFAGPPPTGMTGLPPSSITGSRPGLTSTVPSQSQYGMGTAPPPSGMVPPPPSMSSTNPMNHFQPTPPVGGTPNLPHAYPPSFKSM